MTTFARARLRRTHDRDGRKTISRLILAGLVLLVVWMPAAYSLEVELPKVALRDVATEVVVRDVDAGRSVTLTIGSSSYSQSANADGIATFSEVLVASAGTAEVVVSADGGDSERAVLRVLPGCHRGGNYSGRIWPISNDFNSCRRCTVVWCA